MAELQTALSLIQLVALFLPAWAILMQVFIRILENIDAESNPTLIPFYALTFALGFSALYLFGRGSFYVMNFLVESESVIGSELLSLALTDLMGGGLAFTGLGFVVLLIAGQRKLSYKWYKHVVVLTVAFVICWVVGWTTKNVGITMIGTFLILTVDEFIILRAGNDQIRLSEYL